MTWHSEQNDKRARQTPADIPTLSEDQAAIEPLEQIGSQIGRYELLESIGEGGFGLVFLAEQREPVQRRVALKVIKLGMDTRQVIGRFEAERQALAMMDHPNIAKVFDGGTTQSGRPYFVMELVRGIPITEFCDTNRHSISQRLELFGQVCDAVQHAHQKGIIHRDLKPTNILVAVHSDQPVVKVIDFGVAKATQQRLTEKTVFTKFQQIIGTPDYMSPEQANFNDLDVDTRSDVYSLGVLLYELLTGATPFNLTSLHDAAYDEICRIIREQEPALPSVGISRSGERLVKLSDSRRSNSTTLQRTVRGDLDWIVMKALNKDRTRRYDSASAFKLDIENYLHQRPVVAGPPRFTYRFGKFVRRNRVLTVSSCAVLLVALIGLKILLAGVSVVADRHRDLLAAKARLDVAADRAEQNLLQSRAVVNQYLAELEKSQELLTNTPGTNYLRGELMRLARDYLEEFAAEDSSLADNENLAEAYHNLARLAIATSAQFSQDDAEKAVQDAQKACALSPKQNPTYQATLDEAESARLKFENDQP